MGLAFQIQPITVTPGVAPDTDFTKQSTPHYTFADKIRFKEGFPEKIGGWQALGLDTDFPINGCCRSIYSYVLDNIIYYLLGTHTGLYQLQGNAVFNATPVETTPVNLVDPFTTYYDTLVNNPFAVTTGILTVTVTDAGHPFIAGDLITFSGATGFAGVPAGELNTTVFVSDVTVNTYSFTISTVPTSSTSGGGASVVRASRILNVADPSNGMTDGNNIVVDSVAAAVGGINPADIEGVRVVRNVTPFGYDISVDAVATSSATGGGAVVLFREIPDGQLNPTTGVGYGMGQYGVGLYGVAKYSGAPTPPTIWSFDRFGDLVITTPGNGSPLYSWDSSTNTLPEPVTNAPTDINYTFVTDNIAVTLGAGGVPNRIKWSDQGNLTTWTATAQNQAGEDDIEGAGKFISHAPLRGWNLLFTQTGVYTFRYINKPYVFETKLLDPARGLIGQNARVVVDGVAYWMGVDNFYMYRGANVEPIPSNTSTESTMKNYVFNNLNGANVTKIFAWHNSRYGEIWFHYPSAGANECDRIARYNILEQTWVMDTMDRSAGEYPTPLTQTPYLAQYIATPTMMGFDEGFDEGFYSDIVLDNATVIYKHENGNDANGLALPFVLDTPFFATGDMATVILGGMFQDNLTNGPLDWTINTKLYPNQQHDTVTYTIPLSAQNLILNRRGRYWQYRIAGSTLGQYWRAGVWQQEYRRSGRR